MMAGSFVCLCFQPNIKPGRRRSDTILLMGLRLSCLTFKHAKIDMRLLQADVIDVLECLDL